MKTSSKKDKGRRLQNKVAERISKLLNIPWGYDEMIAPREMGQSGTDIRLVGEAKRLFPFAVECKNQERWAIPEWIKQAKANTSDDLPDWLLFVSRNRMKDPIVVMESETFFKLMEKLLRCQQNDQENND